MTEQRVFEVVGVHRVDVQQIVGQLAGLLGQVVVDLLRQVVNDSPLEVLDGDEEGREHDCGDRHLPAARGSKAEEETANDDERVLQDGADAVEDVAHATTVDAEAGGESAGEVAGIVEEGDGRVDELVEATRSHLHDEVFQQRAARAPVDDGSEERAEGGDDHGQSELPAAGLEAVQVEVVEDGLDHGGAVAEYGREEEAKNCADQTHPEQVLTRSGELQEAGEHVTLPCRSLVRSGVFLAAGRFRLIDRRVLRFGNDLFLTVFCNHPVLCVCLRAVQTRVHAVLLHQLVVSALLDDVSLVHYHDAVTHTNAAQTMSHHHDAQSLLLANAIQRLLNDLFTLTVQRTRRLVQHQHARVTQQRASNRDSLLLTSRQRRTQLTNICVVTLRELTNEPICLHQLRCLHHLFLARVHTTIQQILANRSTEQHGLLRHVTDLIANPFHRQVLHIHTIPRYHATRRTIQTHQQLQNRALPTTTLAHDAHHLVLVDGQIEVVENHGVARLVLEGHVAEDDVALVGRRLLALLVHHLVLVVDHLQEERRRHARLRQRLERGEGVAQRHEGLQQGEVDGNHLAAHQTVSAVVEPAGADLVADVLTCAREITGGVETDLDRVGEGGSAAGVEELRRIVSALTVHDCDRDDEEQRVGHLIRPGHRPEGDTTSR